MTAPTVWYAPLLHPECVPAPLRDRVTCLPCGLPEPCGTRTGQAGAGAREAVRRLLPLGPAESRAALEELLRLGEEHASSGILGQVSVLRIMEQAPREAASGETADIEAFAVSGRVSPASVGKGAPGRDKEEKQAAADDVLLWRARVDSQRILLLAYALEERMLEAARLESRFFRAEEMLRTALGEGDVGDALEFERRDGPQSGDEAAALAFPVSWRLVVEAMLPFLPDRAVLFTTDAAMIGDLFAAELLRPLPEDRAGLVHGWPEQWAAGLLYARMPARRLLGGRDCSAQRPWLDNEYEVLAAPSAGVFSA